MPQQATADDLCEHLVAVRDYIVAQGGKITYVGTPWSRNCRTWVYFDVVLDVDSLRKRFELPPSIVSHSHLGTHDGHEQGLVCQEHHDAVMGPHPKMSSAKIVG